MPRGKEKTKNSSNDKILTVALVMVILFNFYIVSVVSASFETERESLVLFETNSATEFLTLDAIEGSGETIFTTGLYDGIGEYAKTPVYTGNNTWAYSVNGTDEPYAYAYYVMKIPNLDDWIIENISIETTVSPEAGLNVWEYIVSGKVAGEQTVDDGQTTLISTFYDGSGSGQYFNNTFLLSLGQALDIHDKASDGVQHYLVIRVIDNSADGLTAWTNTLKVEIVGSMMESYDIVQQLSLAMGICLTLNVGVLLLMNDRIDIGGYINDIPDKKRR